MKYMHTGQKWLNLSLLNLLFFRIVSLLAEIWPFLNICHSNSENSTCLIPETILSILRIWSSSPKIGASTGRDQTTKVKTISILKVVFISMEEIMRYFRCFLNLKRKAKPFIFLGSSNVNSEFQKSIFWLVLLPKAWTMA